MRPPDRPDQARGQPKRPPEGLFLETPLLNTHLFWSLVAAQQLPRTQEEGCVGPFVRVGFGVYINYLRIDVDSLSGGADVS